MERKRIVRVKAQKVISCTGKKIVKFTFAAMLGVIMFSSCVAERAVSCQTQSAKAVLELCAQDGILDANGQRVMAQLDSINAPAARYMELVSECEEEDGFYDVIGGTDAYEKYCEVCYKNN